MFILVSRFLVRPDFDFSVLPPTGENWDGPREGLLNNRLKSADPHAAAVPSRGKFFIWYW